jgi:hypothetical protein
MSYVLAIIQLCNELIVVVVLAIISPSVTQSLTGNIFTYLNVSYSYVRRKRFAQKHPPFYRHRTLILNNKSAN